MKLSEKDLPSQQWFDRNNGYSYIDKAIEKQYQSNNAQKLKIPTQNGYEDIYSEHLAPKGMNAKLKLERKLKMVNKSINSLKNELFNNRNLPIDDFIEYVENDYAPKIKDAESVSWGIIKTLLNGNNPDEMADVIHDLMLEKSLPYCNKYQINILFSQKSPILGFIKTFVKVKRNDGYVYYLYI